MKVLYDHQIFSAQVYGGISRYFVELMKNFKDNNFMESDLSILFTNNHYLLNAKPRRHFMFFQKYNFKGKARLLNILNKFYSQQYLKHNKFDIFHPTYYDPYFIKYIGNKPFILTVYDMIHEKFPECFSKNDNTSKRKKYLANKASKIIAISNSTKRDLIDIFNIPEEKIKVIYLGYSGNQLKNQGCKIIGLPQKFILFVGNRQGYKNFELFIKSIAPILRKEDEINVVCVGGCKFTRKEIGLFESLNVNNQINQFNVTDVLLSQIYKKALFFVFPSLYEGFGLPILEAFSNGCPVLCGDTSSLPEVASDAAIYFNPYSMNSIRDAINIALNNPKLINDLKTKSIKRLEKFNWKKTAKQTREVYEMVL